MTDEEHWGISDRWDLPADGFGDCEDYQLLKRRLLAEAGLPRRAMRMTVVVDETGDGHAVLMVRTDRGDVVWTTGRTPSCPGTGPATPS
jgi:predicted transglutaminase-like cysteine proteinase